MNNTPLPYNQPDQPVAKKKNRTGVIVGGILIFCLISVCFIQLFKTATSPASSKTTAISAVTQTAYPTYTVYPTYTLMPTYTPIFVLVTPAQTFTPVDTATITQTPTITQIPTKTLIPSNTPLPSKTMDSIYEPKSPGYYLVNAEIGPGSWKSQGKATDGCYWEITTKTGDITDNSFGMAGGTMYIRPTDYQVQLGPECGDWIFLEK